jgi:hypothetical protein
VPVLVVAVHAEVLITRAWVALIWCRSVCAFGALATRASLVWVLLLVEDDAHANAVSVMASVHEAVRVVELYGRLVE